MTDDRSDLVEVYRARHLPEAHAIRLLLEGEGVAVSIWNESLQGIVGEVAMGWSTSPRLMVGQPDEAKARDLIAANRHRSEKSDGEASLKCLGCGALMSHSPVCETCGWTYEHAAEEEPATESPDIEKPGEEPSLGASVLIATPVLPVREVWWELAAVLFVGFIPNFAGSIFSFADGTSSGPYWAVAAKFLFFSLSTTFVTLYVIHRSGEPWPRFGFTRLSAMDVVMAVLLIVLIRYVDAFVDAIFPDLTFNASTGPTPSSSADFALMTLMYVLSTLAEEVVMRAYLITRLSQLLRLPWLAVVISAVLFASYHSYQGTDGVVSALTFGLICGSVFSVYPRIWPLVICHSLTNIMVELANLNVAGKL